MDRGFERCEDRLLLTALEVTNTLDSGPGSLRQAIIDADQTPPSSGQTDLITFDIPGTTPLTISPASPLPSITVPVTIDGTTQPGYTGTPGRLATPVIELNGGGEVFDGLLLGPHSNGSTIDALDIADFGYAGIELQSGQNSIFGNFLGPHLPGTVAVPGNHFGVLVDGAKNTIGGTTLDDANVIGLSNSAQGVGVYLSGGADNDNVVEGDLIGTDPSGRKLANTYGVSFNGGTGNTIGGTVAGAGNTIAYNNGPAVQVYSGSRNALQENLIYGNKQAIVEAPGANDDQAPPFDLSLTKGASGNLELNYSVTGTANQHYVVEFFASDSLGSPAALYLGSADILALSPGAQAPFPITIPLQSGQAVTATITGPKDSSSPGPDGSTSPFATAPAVAYTFVVSNTSGGGFGSLGQAILDANQTPPPSGQTDRIAFDLPTGPLTISPDSPLPPITVPMTIDGTTQPGYTGTPLVALDGGAAGTSVGLVLAAGSDGSAIEGLQIQGFAEGGILVDSSHDTIGGTAAGAGDVIADNGGPAVDVASGSGDGIRRDLIDGNAQAIVLAPGTNDDQLAPSILAVASVPHLTTVDFDVTPNATSGAGSYIVEFFASTSATAGPASTFLGSITVAVGGTSPQDFTAVLTTRTLPTGAVPPGWIVAAPAGPIDAGLGGQTITATVTDAGNSTSAFAAPAPVPPPAQSAFAVTNPTDEAPGAAVGSLRVAILDANLGASGQVITFDILGAGPFTIGIASALPSITVPVTIDGTTQPGYPGTPLVAIDGGGGSFDGLVLGPLSDGSTLQGLAVEGFGGPTTAGSGIRIESTRDRVLADDVQDDGVGVLVDNVAANTIGGTAAGSASTIVGDAAAGVSIAGTSATGNMVAGNFIGTDAAGALDLGNGVGIVIDGGASNNSILDNTVADNLGDGVHVASGSGNSILGDLIYQNQNNDEIGSAIVLDPGANDDQPAPAIQSVDLTGATLTIVYTVSPATMGSSYTVQFFASDIRGGPDLVGPAARFLETSTPDLVSPTQGLTAIFDLAAPLASGATVTATATGPGGTSAFAVPIAPQTTPAVSGFVVINTHDDGAGSLRQVIRHAEQNPPVSGQTDPIIFDIPGAGPFIIDVLSALPTLTVPVTIDGRTQQTGYTGTPLIVVDGGAAGTSDGLVLAAGSDGSAIEGLEIEGFGGDGILVESTGNQIGGTTAGAGDVISGNVGSGIDIGQGSTRNTVVGDFIGTNLTGTSAVPNTTGILIDGASRNTIGGLSPSDVNVISGNSSYGIWIAGSTATGNLVQGNLFGINSASTVLQAEPVSQTSGLPVGVLVEDSPANTIGGTAPGAGNTITGFGVAIDISGLNAAGNVIEGDWIGTDLREVPLPDSVGTGVYLNNAPKNIVGGNTIQGYANSGVNLYGAQTQGNVIQGDVIHGNQVGLAGIVLEDAVNNTLAGNTITGNGYAGIYFFGLRMPLTNTLISSITNNDLQENIQYGILLTDIAKVRGYAGLLNGNHFGGNGIANVGLFTGSVTPGGSSLAAAHSKPAKKVHQSASHPTRKHRVRTRPAARHRSVSSAERPVGGPEARRPLDDPAATAVPRRRVQPAANIPRGPLAHHAAARLNHPRSAGAHAGRASGRSAS